MAYMTIIAVVDVPEEDMPTKSMDGDDPDVMLELGLKQLFCGIDAERVKFITVNRDVTMVAVLEGADPSLWPANTMKGSF